jgi:hypothetical protein
VPNSIPAMMPYRRPIARSFILVGWERFRTVTAMPARLPAQRRTGKRVGTCYVGSTGRAASILLFGRHAVPRRVVAHGAGTECQKLARRRLAATT